MDQLIFASLYHYNIKSGLEKDGVGNAVNHISLSITLINKLALNCPSRAGTEFLGGGILDEPRGSTPADIMTGLT